MEAEVIAERLHALQASQYPVWDRDLGATRPFRYGDAAVLFRATTHLAIYEERFKEAGLPYVSVSGRGYFERPEVGDLVSLLEYLHNPADELALLAALRSPLFGLTDDTLYLLRWKLPGGGRRGNGGPEPASAWSEAPIPLAEGLEDPPATDQAAAVTLCAGLLGRLRARTGRVTVFELLKGAVDETGYLTGLAMDDRRVGMGGRQRRNVEKLLALARDVGGEGLSRFLRRVEALQSREVREGEARPGVPDPESGAVQVMSIHAAKGLEFPVVVVADLGRGKYTPREAPLLRFDPTYGAVCRQRDASGALAEGAAYKWATWLDGRMDAAETKRLLYVACTRAADLLILSGQPGHEGSWLGTILDAWGIPADGPEDQVFPQITYALRIRRPAPGGELARRNVGQAARGPVLLSVPPMALPLAETDATDLVAVTAAATRRGEHELPDLRGVAVVLQGPPRAPGRLVGRLVHRALAASGDPTDIAPERLRALARREGLGSAELVANAAERAARMLARLGRHPLFGILASARRRHPELPFAYQAHDGRLIHGVIDLLVQDAAGAWHIVDWKTEWVGDIETAQAEVADADKPYGHQIRAYQAAVRTNLGLAATGHVVFLRPRIRVVDVPPANGTAREADVELDPTG
jgi:ATP-dependent helicase/nuclease subunit A